MDTKLKILKSNANFADKETSVDCKLGHRIYSCPVFKTRGVNPRYFIGLEDWVDPYLHRGVELSELQYLEWCLGFSISDVTPYTDVLMFTYEHDLLITRKDKYISSYAINKIKEARRV